MGENYLWRGGIAKFDTVGQWSDSTQDPAPTIPGPSDTAIFDLGGTVSGVGNVATLTTEVNVTFTGSITAQTFAVDGDSHGGPATVTVSSGSVLTGAMQFVVSADATVEVGSGATIATNTGTTSPGAIVDFGSISVNGGKITTSTVGDSLSFTVASGTVDADAVSVNGSGVVSTLDIGSGGVVTDSSAIVGAFGGGGSTATVHSGGTWTNSVGMGVGEGGDGTLEIEFGGSLGVTGSSSGEPFGAVTVGLGTGVAGDVTIDGGTMSVTANVDIGATGTGNLSVSGGGSLDVTGTLDTGAFAGGSGTLDVSDDGAAMTLGNYIIGGAGAHDDTIDGSVSVDVTGSLSIGAQSTGVGTLTLSGGATLSIGGDATVGNAGSGSLDIGDGSSVTLSGALTLAGSADGKGTITLGQDVTLAPGGSLTVGSAGTASITLAAGSTLDGSAGAFVVGGTTAAAGTITLGGAGAKVLANVLTVGGVGTGVISIAADSKVNTSGNLTLGQTHGCGNGMITVAGSGDLSAGGNMTVGAGGIGSLDVNGGSLSIAGSMDIADGPASAGDVTFANASLSIGTITVGNQGTATFSANQAAIVTATNIVLGQAGVGNGTFNLDGAGSEIEASQLSVGGGGTGALQVTDKASFQVSGLATMGASASSKVQETATIETNASWIIGGILDVGQKASGQITVDTGGQVAAAQSVVIGDTTKASGTVTVTGTGTLPSALGFGSLLQVGNDGVGTLAVAGGAQVGVGTTSGVVEIAATTGANGIVTLTGTGSELRSQVLTVGGNEAGSGGAGTLAIGSKSEVSVADATVWATGTVVMTGGTLATDPLSMQGALSGSGLVRGTVGNIGGIVASGGTLELSGSITGNGALEVSQGAELRLASEVAASETIGMAVKDATLRLGKLADVAASISGFAQGDTIVVDGVTADAASFSGHTLTLTEAGKSVGTLELNGSYTGTKFHVGTASGGSDVMIVPCFAVGTRLLTVSGEVAVEALTPGDLVPTKSGRLRPVKWIGHRDIQPARYSRRQDVDPVRVQAGAFAPGLPHRDLWLSPDHAVFTGGVLIPIRYLINGATIRQEEAAKILYYHVELDDHDIVLAEGLPAESYLDTGNRGAFENGGVAIQAHAEFARRIWATRSCAPLVVAGPVLAAAREKLLARALGFALTTDPDLRLIVDGETVHPQAEGPTYRFTLPDGAREVRLVSRSVVPAAVVAGSADHRRLGVAVAGLRIDGEVVPPDDPRRARGWHAAEPGWQWTNGDAGLACSGARRVEVTLALLAPYWDSGPMPCGDDDRGAVMKS